MLVDLGQLGLGQLGVRSAATLSSSWATLLAPMTSEVIRGSRSAQTSASWASDWPRRAATSLSARTRASRSLGQHVRGHRAAGGDPRVGRDAVEVAVGEQALGQRRERDAAGADLLQRVEQVVVLDPAVDHRVRRLVDQQRRAERRAGSPRPRGSAPRCTRRSRRRAPCPRAPRRPARPSSPRAACPGRAGASRRCRRSPAPSGAATGPARRAGTCASPTRRTGRATCRSRPWSR